MGIENRPDIHGRPMWEVYGLDVALTKDLRAFLLDWNFAPGLGFNVHSGTSQLARTIHDMYRIILQSFYNDSRRELGAFAAQTSWKLTIDETSGAADAFPDC